MKPRRASPAPTLVEQATLKAARWAWTVLATLTLSCSLNPLPEDPGVSETNGQDIPRNEAEGPVDVGLGPPAATSMPGEGQVVDPEPTNGHAGPGDDPGAPSPPGATPDVPTSMAPTSTAVTPPVAPGPSDTAAPGTAPPETPAPSDDGSVSTGEVEPVEATDAGDAGVSNYALPVDVEAGADSGTNGGSSIVTSDAGTP